MAQRYCVRVHGHEFNKLMDAAAVESLCERWVLSGTDHYHDRLGLVLDRAFEAEDMVV